MLWVALSIVIAACTTLPAILGASSALFGAARVEDGTRMSRVSRRAAIAALASEIRQRSEVQQQIFSGDGLPVVIPIDVPRLNGVSTQLSAAVGSDRPGTQWAQHAGDAADAVGLSLSTQSGPPGFTRLSVSGRGFGTVERVQLFWLDGLHPLRISGRAVEGTNLVATGNAISVSGGGFAGQRVVIPSDAVWGQGSVVAVAEAGGVAFVAVQEPWRVEVLVAMAASSSDGRKTTALLVLSGLPLTDGRVYGWRED